MLKKWYEYFLRPLYFGRRFYLALAGTALLFACAFLFPVLFMPAMFCFVLILLFTIVDYLLLFYKKVPVSATRKLPERFSNGDQNKVEWDLWNHGAFTLNIHFLDELPDQFADKREWLDVKLQPGEQLNHERNFRPVERGVYTFGNIIFLLRSPLQLVIRRFIETEKQDVKVYPAFLDVRRYSLMAYSDTRSEPGNRSIRRIGHSMEFEQIKEYVPGDDVRAVNWKATARKGQLMMNHYTDEKAQQIYCVIDKGRVMKTPFDGMTLMDYAINTTLMLSRVALLKQDKAGVISFSSKRGSIVAADRKASQMNTILESLYREQTTFGESDFERLYIELKKNVPQRSLIVLFTNFESRAGLERQMPYLKSITARHLLLVVFFENTELASFIDKPVASVEDIYRQTIARQFAMEKRLMVREMQQYGILSVLAEPSAITVQAVNKYLELKHRQVI